MTSPLREEQWSKGILLGLKPDPVSGYRATVWFEYTRYLFNEIREGSLIAIRNFSDRMRRPDGTPSSDRDPAFVEYSILQIDQMYPWHYAIQGGGEQGYPGFTVASAISARTDWTEMDIQNRDDVSRIKCESIPLRLAFHSTQGASDELPRLYPDRSMPMPGFEARLLTPMMTNHVLNKDIRADLSFTLGTHVVQHDVSVLIQPGELTRLHFGIFGYTGAGKSNLVSSLVNYLLSYRKQPKVRREMSFKVVLVDLMDEYTGLLIDHLVSHAYSRLIVCGRNALPEAVFNACRDVADGAANPTRIARNAAIDWSDRLILPSDLKQINKRYIKPLMRLILDGKILFYESRRQQGQEFDLDSQEIDKAIGPYAYGPGNTREFRNERVNGLLDKINPLIEQARACEGEDRDDYLQQIHDAVEQELEHIRTQGAADKVNRFLQKVRRQMQTRGTLPENISVNAWGLSRLLNYQPRHEGQFYYPSLNVIIGENESYIAQFVRQLIQQCFDQRRVESILYPTISFIVDEADVFINSSRRPEGRRDQEDNTNPSIVEHATILARRGRKFGLGLGIATQRVRYLDTSIMAQPHTYFISKLPRKSDREVVGEAFAISDETFEQTFGFTVGQWLVTSNDATGLKGVPFPVQVQNANTRVENWLRTRGWQQSMDE